MNGLKIEAGKLICEDCGDDELMLFSTSKKAVIFCRGCQKAWETKAQNLEKLLDLIERSEDDI